MDGEAAFELTGRRLVGACLVTSASLFLGGFVAVLLGDATEAKQALAYGVAWQGTLGTFLSPGTK